MKGETETLAMELSKVNSIRIPIGGNHVQLASQTKLSTLERSLLRGIAYHHAGLHAEDRKLVEKALQMALLPVYALRRRWQWT